MKTIILIIALMGFTAVGSYAQNKNCCCKKKAIHHQTVQKKIVHPQKVAAPKPAATDELAGTYNPADEVLEPCTQYRKHNIVVTECPGIFYDNSDVHDLIIRTESSYMGNYPKPKQENTHVQGPVAPQHITIDNYKGVAPAG